MLKKIAKYIIVVLCVSVLTGCANRDKSICHVNPMNWDSAAEVVYDNENEQYTLLDISFFVRCNVDFDLQTLPVVVRTEAPDSSITIEQYIWTFDSQKAATPTATIQKIAFRNTCMLNQKGRYTFSILPSMSVRGVEAVGLIVNDNEGL